MQTRRAALVAALAACLALLAIVLTWEPAQRVPEGSRTGFRVIIVGIDSFDWYLLSNLKLSEGLQTVTSLAKRSLSGNMEGVRPVLPDVGWASLVRGRPLSEEEVSRLSGPGGRHLTSLVPEMARIVTESGGTALTVGCPGSWPAGTEAGMTIAPCWPEPPREIHGTGLIPALLADGEHQESDSSVALKVAEIVRENEASYSEEFERRILPGHEPVDALWQEALVVARWAFLSDLINLDVGASLIAEMEPDLSFVYLGGLDAVSHRFLAFATPEFFKGQLPPDALARYRGVLGNYYGFIDSAVNRLYRLKDDRTIFIICSVNGIHPSGGAPGISGAHDRGPPGVLIVRGPDIAPSPTPVDIATVDIAPTILAGLGMPIPNWMDGRILVEAVPRGVLDEHPPSYVRDDARAHQPTATVTEPGPLMRKLIRRRIARVRSDLGINEDRP